MKKKFSTLGIVLSIIVIILGALIMTGVFGGDCRSASSAQYGYDSGYATFGADFYTFVTNNAEEAAAATRTVASNQIRIAKLLRNALGLFFIAFGLFGLCGFGIALGGCKRESEVSLQESPEVTSVEEPEKAEVLESTVE